MSALQSVIVSLVAQFGLGTCLLAVGSIGLGILLMRFALSLPVQNTERQPSFSNDYARGIRAPRTQALHDDPNEWRAYPDRK